MTTLITILIAASVTAAGCGKGSKKNVRIEGVEGPFVNFVDDKLTMSTVLKNVQIDYGARIPIPYMPKSYLEIGPDFQSNGYLINIGISAEDLRTLMKDQLQLLDPKTLPGGRPLPGISNGVLPSFAVQAPQIYDIVFYGGQNLFGIFIPVKLPWQDFMGTFRFYDGANAPIGNLSIVGSDTEEKNSGFLLMINLRSKVGSLVGLP